MPRPLSLRSTCSSSDGLGSSSMVFRSVDESYSSTSPITSPTGLSVRRKSDDYARWQRRFSHTHRRMTSLPYVTDTKSKRSSKQFGFSQEINNGREESRSSETILCTLFDPNGDGILWPTNSFHAIRMLGFGQLSGILISISCHTLLSYPLQIGNRAGNGEWTRWIPDPYMRIRMNDIKAFNNSTLGKNTHSLLEKYAASIRYYSRLYRLYQVDFFDGLAIALEMRHTLNSGAIVLFLFAWIIFRFCLARRDGKMDVEDIINFLDGTHFHILAMKAKVSRSTQAFPVQSRRSSSSSNHWKVSSQEQIDLSWA